MKKYCLLLLLFVACVIKTNAVIRLPAIISDNMVLEQRTKVTLWGWASAGEKITVQCSWNRQSVSVTADKDGAWKLAVTTITAGGPYTIIFKGQNQLMIRNVMLGEVWLCSGQSNMEFPLAKQAGWRTGVFNYEQELKKVNDPQLRLFTVKQEIAGEPLQDVSGQWDGGNPETAAGFSAVAYYFGWEIRKVTGFPVGLIHASWGGTPAESWVRKDVLLGDKDLAPIMERYESAIKTYPADLEKSKQVLANWVQDSVGHKKPALVVDPLKNPKSPTKLYNAMIHPVTSFTIKGVIWYQGESNSDRSYQYRKLFPALINSWRQEWKADFPFYFVQIAPHRTKIPEIREAQLLTYQTVPKTGMAVITEAGDSLDIHPRNKEIPGQRLALWALANDYGKQLTYSGPVYQSMKRVGDKLQLSFSFVDGGLQFGKEGPGGFTVAEKDQQFVPAEARIEGNTVLVWSKAVKAPVAVRFGWVNVPHATLYNKAGLPATPFRTDNWPGQTINEK